MTTFYDGTGVPTGTVPTGSAYTGSALSGSAPTAGSWSPSLPAGFPRDEFTGDLVCTGITPVTHDVVDVSFRACDGGTLPFSPGQYYTFTFAQLGVDRCYSVSSTPALDGAGVEEFTVTVKRVPGGPVSTFLHEDFRAGDTVRADGPYGVFGSDVRPGAGALYLSAGSGITPFLSMMRARRALLEQGERTLPLWSSVVHVHAARTPADLVHRAEVMAMSDRHETTVIPVCSADSAAEAWAGVRGRLTSQKLSLLVPDLADREVFICGPTPYMEAVLTMVVELGVPHDRIHLESYVFGETPRVPQPVMETSGSGDAGGPGGSEGAGVPGETGVTGVTGVPEETGAPGSVAKGASAAAPVALADPLVRPSEGDAGGGGEGASAAVFSVEFRGAGCMVACPKGMTILEAARKAGVAHPSSCSEGVCGTCKSTMVSGEVDMDHAGGIRPREIREGKILPCCSVPTTDIVME